MSIEKKWIEWNDCCPNCGDGVSVLTDAEQDWSHPVAYDGDKAKCNVCKWEGSVVVIDDDKAYLDDGNIEEL